jgi:hypothetical protein
MFGTELSWEFMRDLGLVVFGVGGALVAFGFSFSRILLRELGPPTRYTHESPVRGYSQRTGKSFQPNDYQPLALSIEHSGAVS